MLEFYVRNQCHNSPLGLVNQRPGAVSLSQCLGVKERGGTLAEATGVSERRRPANEHPRLASEHLAFVHSQQDLQWAAGFRISSA